MTKSVLIVGAGEFGLATALELSRKGGYSITILDRSPPPVLDGSSVDLNRIVRPDYSDSDYCQMALEAIEKWKTDPIFANCYHESGIVFSSAVEDGYAHKSLANIGTSGIVASAVADKKDIQKVFPGWQSEAKFKGYANKTAGWAFAEKAVRQCANYLSHNGVSFICGPSGTVTEILKSSADLQGHAAGVKVETGTKIFADLVVIAAGAWSHGLLPNNCLGHKRLLATGQPVAFIKLTPQEADALKEMPVFLSHDNGFFVFPPTEDGMLKIARHCYGYTLHRETPSGAVEPLPPHKPVISCDLPDNMEQFLRENCGWIFGSAIGSRPFSKSKLCFYSETSDGNFIFDYHPQLKNVFVCCGGSGHGFKFFPVLGKYSVGCIERSLDSRLLKKWSWTKDGLDPDFAVIDGSRYGPKRKEVTIKSHL